MVQTVKPVFRIEIMDLDVVPPLQKPRNGSVGHTIAAAMEASCERFERRLHISDAMLSTVTESAIKFDASPLLELPICLDVEGGVFG